MTTTGCIGKICKLRSHAEIRRSDGIPALRHLCMLQPGCMASILLDSAFLSGEHPLSTARTVPKGPKVSPVRTIVSLVVLLNVGTVCVIELRAGLGLYLTGKALATHQGDDAASDPAAVENSNAPPKPRLEVKRITMQEARAMVKMFPTESVLRENEAETIYRYQWFSLLRGLIGEKAPEIFISADKGDPPMYQTFFTEGDEAGGNYVGPASPDVGGAGLPPEDFAAGGPGRGMGRPPQGMGGRGGMGGPPGMGGGGGRKGGGGGGGGGGMRPPAEFPEEPKTEEPKTEEPKTEEPKTEEPKTEEPKTEEPKTEEPKTEEPKTDPAPAAPQG